MFVHRRGLGTFFVLQLVLCLTAFAGNWNTNVRTLVNERLDPIVNPNAVAGHMHAVIGGSAFGASYSFEDSQNSACTSFPISVDKSNYWMPKLYWINDGGTSFTPLPQNHRVYYFRIKAPETSVIQPFPEGLRILVGNPNAKTANSVSFNFICRTATQFNGPTDVETDNFNIKRDCPLGLLVQARFPSCWDGKRLYSSDGSHMSYPASGSFWYGPCPWSHPVRLPSIVLENYYLTSKWAPGEALAGNLAWANGDTTGFAVHGDFTNGWDTAILGRALNDSVCSADKDMTFQECPVFQPFIKDAPCSPQKGQMLESTGNVDLVPIPSLPGCNPLWGTSGAKPTCSTPPNQPDVSKFTGTDGSLIPKTPQSAILPTAPGWKNIGCMQDSGAMLLNGTGYNDANVTQTSCLDSCLRSGFPYAAIGKMWGKTWDCQCGASISQSAGYFPSACNLTCPGNLAQACGGSGAHSVFYAPGNTTTTVKFTSDLGCYASPAAGLPSLETQASYNWTSWDKMTVKTCLQGCADRGFGWGAIKMGAQCFCGSNDKFSLGRGSYVASSACTAKCSGDKTESCGDWNKLNVFNVAAMGFTATNLVKPLGYIQCYSGSNASLSGTGFWDSKLTPQRCQSSCLELGYSLASVWSTGMCLCGNTLKSDGVLPAAMCSGKCPGNATTPLPGNAPLTCGAQWNIGELYNTSAVAKDVSTASGPRPAGWQGCFSNNDNVLLKDYTISDGQMTVKKCLSSCDELGYSYAGLQSQTQCRCSKTGPSSSIVPVASNVNCNLACPGNSTQTCGGWSKVEIYRLTPSSIPGGATALPGYRGCFNGTSGLSGYSWNDWTNMTVQTCTKGCRELGYSISALNGAKCSCGNTWTGGPQLSSLSCGYNCSGDSTQRCGGWPSMSSVYSSSAGSASVEPQGYLGCWNDSSVSRALTGYSTYIGDGMTVTSCRTICSVKKYLLAGVEDSRFCYCGSSLLSTSIKQPSSFCAKPCLGDASQNCGTWNNMALYQASTSGAALSSLPRNAPGSNTTFSSAIPTLSIAPSSSRPSSSASSASSISTVSRSANVTLSASSTSTSKASTVSSTSLSKTTSGSASNSSSTSKSLTSSSSTASAAQAIIKPSSVSAVPGPFSGSSTVSISASSSSKSSSASPISSSRSSASSASPSSQVVVKAIAATSSSSSAASSKVTFSASTSIASLKSISSAPSASSSMSVAKDGDYRGCYAPGTFLSQSRNVTKQAGMSVDFCRRFCGAVGATDAALSGGDTCSCGAAAQLGAAVADSTCSSKCNGNATQSCGSASQVSVFRSTAITASSSFTPTYIGCMASDTSSTRALTLVLDTIPSLTTVTCAAQCQSRGFTVYGTQSGKTCLCGYAVPSSGIVADAQCSVQCSGGGGTCGGPTQITVYGLPPGSPKLHAAILTSSIGGSTSTTSASTSKAINCPVKSSTAISTSPLTSVLSASSSTKTSAPSSSSTPARVRRSRTL